MTESDPVATQTPAIPAGEIIAPRDAWFFKKWLGISLFVIGFGGYFLYDG